MNRLLRVAGGITLGVLMLPVVVLGLHAGSLVSVMASASGQDAVEVTLASGGLALFVDLGLGMPLAWMVARVVSPVWRRWIGTLLVVPLLMPPLVLGLILAYVVGPAGPVGSTFSLANSYLGLVIAQIYESLPFFVFTAWGYLAALPREIEEDALVLGKPPWSTFWFATWPMARPGFALAAGMAWARIVGAFGAPVVIAYHPSGLPVAIWIQLQEQGLPAALGLAVWLIIATLPLPVWLHWRYGHVRNVG